MRPWGSIVFKTALHGLEAPLWRTPPWLIAARMQRYRRRMGRWPRVMRPRTMNEKLQHRLIFDRRPILTTLTGKLESRSYVTQRLGRSDAQAGLLAVARSVADLATLQLPPRYIMKSSHASGRYRVVTPQQPLAQDAQSALVAAWLAEDYGRRFLEPNYHGLERCVVFEELLAWHGALPLDVKVFCYQGEPRWLYLVSGRPHAAMDSFVDLAWNRLAVQQADHPAHDILPPRPACLEALLRDAATLSAGLDHLRVDMLVTDHGYRVGELTVANGSGMVLYDPPSYDEVFGAMWQLPPLRVLRGWR